MSGERAIGAALITGGTSGIGLATARLLHERGGRVAVTGSTSDSVDAARRVLPAEVLVVRADASTLEGAERAADAVGCGRGSAR